MPSNLQRRFLRIFSMSAPAPQSTLLALPDLPAHGAYDSNGTAWLADGELGGGDVAVAASAEFGAGAGSATAASDVHTPCRATLSALAALIGQPLMSDCHITSTETGAVIPAHLLLLHRSPRFRCYGPGSTFPTTASPADINRALQRFYFDAPVEATTHGGTFILEDMVGAPSDGVPPWRPHEPSLSEYLLERFEADVAPSAAPVPTAPPCLPPTSSTHSALLDMRLECVAEAASGDGGGDGPAGAGAGVPSQVHAHRVLLAVRSPSLSRMLSSRMREGIHREVKGMERLPVTLALLRYIYW